MFETSVRLAQLDFSVENPVLNDPINRGVAEISYDPLFGPNVPLGYIVIGVFIVNPEYIPSDNESNSGSGSGRMWNVTSFHMGLMGILNIALPTYTLALAPKYMCLCIFSFMHGLMSFAAHYARCSPIPPAIALKHPLPRAHRGMCYGNTPWHVFQS